MQREYRLKSERTFNLIYKRGERYSDKLILLFALKSRYMNIKVGFSVSKKVGNSVIRNLVRRRLKESFRSMIKDVKQGYSYIIVAKAGIEKVDYHTINQSLKSLMIKANKYNK